MNVHRLLLAAVAALMTVLIASPAHARPLNNTDGTVQPRKACARIIVAAAEGDCIVHKGFHVQSEPATTARPRGADRHTARRHHRHHRHHRAAYTSRGMSQAFRLGRVDR
jgi:Flp pilus assembly protein CpaB